MDEYRRDPWGTWRDNAHAALIASVVANSFRAPKSRAFTTDDFMLLDPEIALAKREADQHRQAQMFLDFLKAVAVPKDSRGH